ncbi:hypothetical protein ED21_25963 [Erythrobacter sp. SD-21]|nr:hypothetical protein ED21_25963 [Erythrobacter sp. SD-21]
MAGTSAHADGVGAGTLIENTASATYDDGTGSVTIPSNTVSVRVDELLDVTLTSLNSGPVAAEPGSAVLTFEITNTGNGPEAFTLTANPSVPGNDFDSTVDLIAVDTNGNGVYDPGIDQILTGPETTPVLDAEENLTLFVIVTVPGEVADGEQSDVDLLAEAVTGTGAPGTVFAGQGVDGGDAIVGANGASANAIGTLLVGITSVDLIKSATIADRFGGTSAVPGSVVSYTITANVTGSGSVSDLVVSDTFPTGTTYSNGTLKLDSGSLTDADDADVGEATSTDISVDLGTVAGGTSRTITFDVIID